MEKDLFRDPQYLLSQQYRTANNLNARKELHARFSTNRYDWFLWVFDRLDLPEKADILELGCGAGDLWQKNIERIPRDWQVNLTDFSLGMVQAARHLLDTQRSFRFIQVNAQGLPFPEGQFDAVIANHMLYHVPDRSMALQEIRRVLKPGGKLFAATNGESHLRELQELVERFSPQAFLPPSRLSFTAENGAADLRRYFSQVTWEGYPDALEVTEAEPLAAYILSMTRTAYLEDPRGQNDRLVEFLRQEIGRLGSIHITKSTGLFTSYR